MSKIHCEPHQTGISFTYDGVADIKRLDCIHFLPALSHQPVAYASYRKFSIAEMFTEALLQDKHMRAFFSVFVKKKINGGCFLSRCCQNSFVTPRNDAVSPVGEPSWSRCKRCPRKREERMPNLDFFLDFSSWCAVLV